VYAAVIWSQVGLAQPQWRFHVAFEDGTGARDTIWMVFDETATVGSNFNPLVDAALGEGQVEMDLSQFNVWTPNWSNDSTKTVAWPYSEFPFHQAVIEGFNFLLPMTIKWDMSLGALSFLPPGGPINGGSIYNTYFYYFNNCGGPPCGSFDIGLVDSVVVEDTGPAELFGLSFTVGREETLTVGNPTAGSEILHVWPNPVIDYLNFRTGIAVSSVEVFDGLGISHLLADTPTHGNQVNVRELKPGVYELRITTTARSYYHAKFIKAN